MQWRPADWSTILIPDAPIAELVVRGTLMYFLLFVMMRIAGRRLLGRFSMTHILVTLLIAVAVRGGITGPFQRVGDAAISASVILAWDMGLDRLAYHVPAARGFLRHGPLQVIRDGELMTRHIQRHLLTETGSGRRESAPGRT